MEKLEILLAPFLICVILTGIHGYLGIHVLARHVIFVDLAMAQVAALGTTIAFLWGYDPRSQEAYFISLSFSLAHAAILALTRSRKERVPQEATIGLVYAIATALAILLADSSPHGTEHLKDMLTGSIVWVTWPQIIKTGIIYAVLGAFHYIYRDRFFLISTDPERAIAQGLNVPLWDFLFYTTFGIIITSSVQIAGVLLVFCYLIAPAVCAVQFSDKLGARLAIGWIVGILVSAIGLFFSYDRPSGPMIILFFAIFLMIASAYRYLKNAERRGTALAKLGAYAVSSLLLCLIFYRVFAPPEEHEHGKPEHAIGSSNADLLHALSDEHDNVRAAACAELGKKGVNEAIPQLRKLLIEDPSAAVKEKAATALAGLHATEAIPELRVEAKKESEDVWVRLHVAQSLAELGDEESISHLLTLGLTAKQALIKREVAETLSRFVEGAPKDIAKLSDEKLDNLFIEIRGRWEKAGQKAKWNEAKKLYEF